MRDDEVVLRFEDMNKGEANVLAADLSDFLQERTPVEASVRRDDPRTQDFGATLILILGTASVQVIAKAIGTWIQKHREAKGTLKVGDVSLELSNVDTKTLSSLMEKGLETARR